MNLKSLIVTPVELSPGAELDEEWLGFAVALPLSPPPQPAISIAGGTHGEGRIDGMTMTTFHGTTVWAPAGCAIGRGERVIA